MAWRLGRKALHFERRMMPLLFQDEVAPPDRASLIRVEPCTPEFARHGVAAWHSRLPITQVGPWKIAFAGHYQHTCFAVALWHNPSARTLPSDWLELRRLAVAPDAPHCTASRMLGQMTRWIRRNMPSVPTLVSYQDCDVHTGTIYRAAGWYPAYESKRRTRDRSKPRVGTRRDYRSNLNGATTDSAPKVRWQLQLHDGIGHSPLSRDAEVA
jgi:hypothetical protein